MASCSMAVSLSSLPHRSLVDLKTSRKHTCCNSPPLRPAWGLRFREEVVGNTDPATAAEKSLRGIFYKSWTEPWPQLTASRLGRGPLSLRLGLPSQPHVGENAVHGSASPFEAWRAEGLACGECSRLDALPARPWRRSGTGSGRTTRATPLGPCCSNEAPRARALARRAPGFRIAPQPRRDPRFYREMEEKPSGRKPNCPWESGAIWCRI